MISMTNGKNVRVMTLVENTVSSSLMEGGGLLSTVWANMVLTTESNTKVKAAMEALVGSKLGTEENSIKDDRMIALLPMLYIVVVLYLYYSKIFRNKTC